MESASLIGKSLRVLFSIKTLYGQRWYHNMIERVLGYQKLDMVYQTITWLIHNYLGKGVRKPISSCATKAIRDRYPESDDKYVGFLDDEETEMDFSWIFER